MYINKEAQSSRTVCVCVRVCSSIHQSIRCTCAENAVRPRPTLSRTIKTWKTRANVATFPEHSRLTPVINNIKTICGRAPYTFFFVRCVHIFSGYAFTVRARARVLHCQLMQKVTHCTPEWRSWARNAAKRCVWCVWVLCVCAVCAQNTLSFCVLKKTKTCDFTSANTLTDKTVNTFTQIARKNLFFL